MKIVCVGEATLDRYQNGKDLAGGTSLNVAKVIKRFDIRNEIFLVSAVGSDQDGELLKSKIIENNISPVLQVLEGKSSMIEIKITNGERHFLHYDAGVLENFQLNEDQIRVIEEANITFFVCFNQIEHLFKAAIIIESKALKVADYTDLIDYEKELKIVDDTIDFVDVLFFGLEITDRIIIEKLKEKALHYKKLIVITLGKDGACAFHNGKEYRVTPQETVKVVDTTGAGDTFIAIFIYHFYNSNNIDLALQKATIEATDTIQKIGI